MSAVTIKRFKIIYRLEESPDPLLDFTKVLKAGAEDPHIFAYDPYY